MTGSRPEARLEGALIMKAAGGPIVVAAVRRAFGQNRRVVLCYLARHQRERI
jgi:hypothetical protein